MKIFCLAATLAVAAAAPVDRVASAFAEFKTQFGRVRHLPPPPPSRPPPCATRSIRGLQAHSPGWQIGGGKRGISRQGAALHGGKGHAPQGGGQAREGARDR